MSEGDSQKFDWNGALGLIDDGEEWIVNAVHSDRSHHRLAKAATREEAVRIGRSISGAVISTFVPEREWIYGVKEQSSLFRRLGARYDPECTTWYIPEELPGPRREPLEAHYPHGRKLVMDRTVEVVAEAAINAALADRVYLNAGYQEKDRVKALGALYDHRRKKWFVSRTGPLKLFLRWLPPDCAGAGGEGEAPVSGVLKDPIFLRVPYDWEILARRKGALYIRSRSAWVAPAGLDEQTFSEWSRIPERRSARMSFTRMLRTVGYDPDREENQNFRMEPDGKKHRFYVLGDYDRPSGEYSIFLNSVPSGWLTNYRTGMYRKWVYRFGGDHREFLIRKPCGFEFLPPENDYEYQEGYGDDNDDEYGEIY